MSHVTVIIRALPKSPSTAIIVIATDSGLVIRVNDVSFIIVVLFILLACAEFFWFQLEIPK